MSLSQALKWSFLAELAAKAIQPTVFVVLARLLTPEDFGVMAAALMVISFSQIFWEAGMAQALIQRQTDVEDAANAAFWINVALGAVVAAALFLAASPIAVAVFHDARVAAVLQVMTVQVALAAICAVHTALLQKKMGFKQLFWVRFATVGIPSIASIPLAWAGWGYWALVAGTLAGQAAQAVVLWRASSWRPRWSFQVQVAREIGRFGAWVGISGLLAWFYLWADSFVLGLYLGSHDLGLYRTGSQFTEFVFACVFAPVAPVLYSHLARTQSDAREITKAADKIIRGLIAVGIPLAAVAFSLAPQIEATLFGAKWQGVGLVIGTMALMHGLSWIVGMNGEIYRAIGRPSLETIVPATVLAVYLAAYIYAARFGLEFFVWTRFALAAFAVCLHLAMIRKILGVALLPVAGYLLRITLICAAVLFVVDGLILQNVQGAWMQLLTGGIVAIAVIGAILFFLERNGLLKDIGRLMGRGVV